MKKYENKIKSQSYTQKPCKHYNMLAKFAKQMDHYKHPFFKTSDIVMMSIETITSHMHNNPLFTDYRSKNVYINYYVENGNVQIVCILGKNITSELEIEGFTIRDNRIILYDGPIMDSFNDFFMYMSGQFDTKTK